LIYASYNRSGNLKPKRVWISSRHPADLDELLAVNLDLDAEPTELRCPGWRGEFDLAEPDGGAAQPAGLGQCAGMGSPAGRGQRDWIWLVE
jgi:hypothetical protein